MKDRTRARLVAFAFVLLAAGCGSPTSSPGGSAAPTSIAVTSPGPTPPPGDVSYYFLIEEIGLGPRGYVSLRNFTDVAASLDSVFLCQPDGCVDLPDVTVEPNEIVRVALADEAGLENVVMTGASLDLPPADGEVAIYSRDDVRDPAAMRYYVQWGSTPHELTNIAVEAKLSGTTTYAPSGPTGTRLWKTAGGVWVWDSK